MSNVTTKPFKIRLKKGDTVVVRAGREKGKTGKITAVHPRDNKATVEGINTAKKHLKPTRANPQGGIIEITRPIWIGKLGILDPSTKKAARIGYKAGKDGKKIRISKASGKEIS